MEYAQTVLVQIAAERIDDASQSGGLFAELDEHRGYLEQQPGFEDMRVTRSVNAQGNVLLVVETRWADDQSLVQYETREPNVAGIIRKHERLIVRDSLQVLDMEEMRAGRRHVSPAAEATERVAMPLLIPLGILAFALLVIYGLSRIYLEVPAEVATGLAAGIAAGVILVAWYITARPEVSAWQIGAIGSVAAAVLIGGALFAIVHDDGATAEEEPAAGGEMPDGEMPDGEMPDGEMPPADETPTGDANVFEIAMVPTIEFDTDTMTLPAESEVTVTADNQDDAIPHNWAMYESQEAAESGEEAIALTEICPAPCVDEVTFTPPPPGEYFFRCDVHPQQMVGTISVE